MGSISRFPPPLIISAVPLIPMMLSPCIAKARMALKEIMDTLKEVKTLEDRLIGLSKDRKTTFEEGEKGGVSLRSSGCPAGV